jgi:hypothetical protein
MYSDATVDERPTDVGGAVGLKEGENVVHAFTWNGE